jgi:sugar lactone lactonase YvrE
MSMFRAATVFTSILFSCATLAQRPSDPTLLVPANAPSLDYVAVENGIALPAGVTMGPPAATAFDSKGHMFILNRGPQPLMEFDADGKFLRAFGEGLFTRAHGMKIDKDDNIWTTDVGGHVVMKLSPAGQVLLTIGAKGKSGDFNETHLLNEPTDIALGRGGDVFVTQGHTAGKGDPRVIKFAKDGTFLATWGGRGSEPGKFTVAHGIALDSRGLLWVADRENQRIQIFDQNGKFVRENKYAGLPCSLNIGKRYIYMVNGFAGQLLRLDLSGKVLAAVGKAGKGLGEFGEAHSIMVSPKGVIYVSDTVNSALQKFVRQQEGAKR